MDPERWRRVTALFHAAVGQEPARRDAFLADACRDDPSLRAEVDVLLGGDAEAADPLISPVSRLTSGVTLG